MSRLECAVGLASDDRMHGYAILDDGAVSTSPLCGKPVTFTTSGGDDDLMCAECLPLFAAALGLPPNAFEDCGE